MPVKDPLRDRIPFQKKIYYPYELFRYMSVKDADKLQDKLQIMYFDREPGEKRQIIERSKGNPDLVETYQDEAFNKLIMTEYAYDAAILSKRRNDPVAQELVEQMNDYNLKVERQHMSRPPAPTETPGVSEKPEATEGIEKSEKVQEEQTE